MRQNDERSRLLRLYEQYGSATYYSDAIPLYEQAIKNDPKNVGDLFDLGYLHERRARQLHEEATALYERALAHCPKHVSAVPNLNPDYYKVLAHLMHCYIRSGNTHKAIQYVKDLIMSQPDDPRLYCALCNCYLIANQPDDAEKTINAALKLDGNNKYVLYFAGEVEKIKGRNEAALECWKRAYDLDNEIPDSLFSIAFMLDYLQRNEEAMMVWNEIAQWLEKRGYDIEAQMPRDEIAKLEARMIRARKDQKETG